MAMKKPKSIETKRVPFNFLQILKMSSRPTWGIASLRQTDFIPGYIAERACREGLLDLAGMYDDVAYTIV
jgi:hypothetical protein